jgi:tetratricopeptide (TPR) repeat protein
VTLLRDALVAYVTLALALVMHWASAGGRRRWLLLGLAFGAAALVKQSFLFFPAVMAIWRAATVQARPRDRMVATGFVTLGMALALLPVILRNLAVGAPALAMNGSASAMLALYHTANATPFDVVVGPEYPRLLMATEGRFLSSLLEAARTHADAWGILILTLKKLLYTWHGFESPNNVDFYLFRQGAPLIAALPVTFVVLAPLAAIGVAARRGMNSWPIFVAILASVPTLVLGTVLSRYRAPIGAALLPLAGAGVVRLASWISDRRWLRAGAAAGATAIYLAWAMGSPSGKDPGERAHKYAWAGVEAIARGEPAYAVLNLQESIRLEPGSPKVEARLGQALLAAGDPRGALQHVEAAARSFDSSALRELHARVLATVGRREEAIVQARAALSADPERAEVRELLDRLERDAASAADVAPPREVIP